MSSPDALTWKTWAILAACAYNCSILLFSRGLTSRTFLGVDPLFDAGGCWTVLVFAGIYAATCRAYEDVPWLYLVLFAAKMFYGAKWIWILSPRNPRKALGLAVPPGWGLPRTATDFPSKVFFASFGAGDFAFGFFFLYLFVQHV
mmetsp:Transcript_1165/g.2549  ORF Transcript_1165/g.2549 Transcript_1165/m.2549 type:complete len:145 (+) Transcript_1165:94-528(+)